MQLLWGECTWEEIAQAAKEDYIVVFPVGGIEQHGPMLPVDVDAYHAEKWALDGAERARDKYDVNVLVLPLLPYGQSSGHLDFPGTIWLSSQTHEAVLREVMQCVFGYGFRSIVIINGHGNNTHTIHAACQDLRTELAQASKNARMFIFPEHGHPVVAAANRELWGKGGAFAAERDGMHAAAYETSETLADRPQLVKQEKMVKPTLRRLDTPTWVWRIKEMSESGAFGDPSISTAEAGARIWEAWTEGISQFIRSVSEESGSGRRR